METFTENAILEMGKNLRKAGVWFYYYQTDEGLYLVFYMIKGGNKVEVAKIAL